MRKWILLALIFVGSLGAAEQRIPHSEVEGDPSTLVGGHVNVITGSFVDAEMDIVVAGAEPLSLCRVYSSSDWAGGTLSDGWNHSFSSKGIVGWDDQGCWTALPEPTCSTPLYRSSSNPGELYDAYEYRNREGPPPLVGYYLCDPRPFLSRCEKGLTNSGTGLFSARTSVRSNEAIWSSKTLTLKQGDGGTRSFVARDSMLPMTLDLKEEKRPNGNRIVYERQSANLVKVIAKDSNQKVLGWLELHHVDGRLMSVNTSDLRHVTYSHKEFHNNHAPEGVQASRCRLEKRQVANLPDVTYGYSYHKVSDKNLLSHNAEKVVCKQLPDGRHLSIEYYNDKEGKVSALKAPVGEGGTDVPIYSFQYTSNATTVFDALQHKTVYRYNLEQRPELIEHYAGKNALFHDHFYWGQGESATDLVCRALTNSEKVVRSCRCLKYDDKHNVVREELCGNLSGKGATPPELNAQGQVINDCEKYVQTYTYTKDGFNLLESEVDGCTGKTVTYRYKKNSDLLIAKFTQDRAGHILLREFHDYNPAGVLIQTISDDGCSQDPNDFTEVTVRLVRVITPKADMPCMGLPEVIEEFGVDPQTKALILITRIENSYTKEGWLATQVHTGSDGVCAYTLAWEYDAYGNVTQEVDAAGQTTTRKFDANSNLLYEQGPNQKVHHIFTYDLGNRLLTKNEIHTSGLTLTTTYTYDALGQKTSVTDPFGSKTTYAYDAFGHQTLITLPAQVTVDGLATGTIQCSYDIAGNCTEIIDPLGAKTEKDYTIRSQPFEMRYADGTKEIHLYNLDGTLAEQTARNKMVTRYSYDILGHVTEKECIGRNGEHLSLTTFKYKSDRLVQETDANGIETHYQYDHAGRVSHIIRDTEMTTYEYDTLGRKAKTTIWYCDTDAQVTLKTYDKLDRIENETVTNIQGEVLSRVDYMYDPSGNPTQITTYTQQGPALTQMTYDGRGQRTQLIDALDHVTHTSYDYSGFVLRVKEDDPLGQQCITTYDPAGRVAAVEVKNPLGVTLAKHQILYDLAGHPILRTDTVITSDTPERTVTTRWEYDKKGRLERLIEADTKITSYRYNDYGEQEAIILPDSVEIQFEYDALGRLSAYKGSDGSFSYRYAYDPNSNLISVEDTNTHSTTFRTYDEHNRLTHERLGNGLDIGYGHDGLGRVKHLVLPDGSSVTYHYDALHLRSVERLDGDHQSLYTHTYNSFDLANHLTSSTLLNGIHVDHMWDKKGQSLGSYSPTYSEALTSYDKVGNLLENEIQDLLGSLQCRYTYDGLYQLQGEISHVDHVYSHDSLYNRLLKDQTAYTVNGLNQLLQEGDTCYSYDKRGNLVAVRDQQYTYDALGRLLAVDTPTERITYSYDAFNRRLSKEIVSKSSKQVDSQLFFYSGQNEIGATDTSHTITELRILGSGLGAEIGAAVAVELNGQLYIPQSDHNGNIVTLLDSQGDIVEGYRYSAFGEQTIIGNNGWTRFSTSKGPISNSAVNMPWGFASKRIDPETGWVFFGRRHYAPDIGRWVTPDPLGYDAGPNLYAYIKNSPLTHFDLYGLKDEDKKGPKSPMERDQSRGGSAGWGSARGAWNTISDPIGTLGRWGAYAKDMGSALMSGDFSDITERWKRKSESERYAFIGERAGEAVAAITTAGLASSRFVGGAVVTAGQRVVSAFRGASTLNTFHENASRLSETGQNNIRVLRTWARKNNWQQKPNPEGRPEVWGSPNIINGKWEWNLKIKPGPSPREGLQAGSHTARFSARERRMNEAGNTDFEYINPFTGDRGNKADYSHLPLEHEYFRY